MDQTTTPADVTWLGAGSIRHTPLPYDDVVRLCRGVDLNTERLELGTTGTWLFGTPQHAAVFAELMAGRGWHFGAPTLIPLKMFPRHNITLIGGPA